MPNNQFPVTAALLSNQQLLQATMEDAEIDYVTILPGNDTFSKTLWSSFFSFTVLSLTILRTTE